MQKVQLDSIITFEGSKLNLIPDLSRWTLRLCVAIKPLLFPCNLLTSLTEGIFILLDIRTLQSHLYPHLIFHSFLRLELN